MTPAEVMIGRVVHGDREVIAAVLARAFADDPILRREGLVRREAREVEGGKRPLRRAGAAA